MVSVEQITIEAPNLDDTNKNLYKFNLFMSDGEKITYKSDCLYTVNTSENVVEQMLTIPSKDDLRNLSDIFNKIKATFLEKHEEWFEDKFTSSTLDDLFKNFLYPNVVENCIDLKISISPEMINKIKEVSDNDSNFCSISPTFSFDSIVLNIDDNKMNCLVTLNDFYIPHTKDDAESEVLVKKTNINEEEPENQEEDEEPEMKEENAASLEINNEEENSSELQEMDFDTSNLVDSEIKVNVEDYMIIYKYILGKIKENKIKEIEKICASKNINMEILDYEDIFDDSEDEYLSSDAESENSDDDTSFN